MQGGIERPEHQNGEGVLAFLYMELLINNKNNRSLSRSWKNWNVRAKRSRKMLR